MGTGQSKTSRIRGGGPGAWLQEIFEKKQFYAIWSKNAGILGDKRVQKSPSQFKKNIFVVVVIFNQ